MPDNPTPSDLADLAKDWRNIHAHPPAILHHYTTAAGIMGIFSSQRLWATNTRFLNDPSEVQYAVKLVAEALEEEEKAYIKARGADMRLTAPDIVAAVAGKRIPRVETWAKDLLRAFHNQREVYVTCFCEEGDLLSQWRGYAEAGGGYAIGIAVDTAWPKGNMENDAQATVLRRVIYEPDTQRQMIRNWIRAMFESDLAWRQARRDHIKRIFPEAQGAGESAPPETRTTPEATDIPKDEEPSVTIRGVSVRSVHRVLNLLRTYRVFRPAEEEARELYKTIETNVARFLAECLISFKDPAYAAEREWRAIHFASDGSPVKFRTRGGNIIPFVELDLTTADGSAPARLPIRHITYGPTLESGVTDRSLKMICARAGYANSEVGVCQSSIPFRAV